MKKIFFCSLVFSLSLASYATSPQAGDTLVTAVDWERIERGLSTGDFSCRGSCANVSIDWKATWLTVSGKKYRDQKRSDIAYCISEIQKFKNSIDDLARMESDAELDRSQAVLLRAMHENSLKSVEIYCESRLGVRKTRNLKASILN